MKNLTRIVFLLSLLGVMNLNAQTAVDAHGHLSVSGSQMIGEHGDQVQLRGMSLFWSQWESEFYTANVVDQLKNDWCTNIVRCAMAVEEGGYLTDPTTEKARVKAVVDACIEKGMYVIIDWHDHDAANHKTEAITFFTEMAQLYGSYPNVIYEIYNEPLLVSWSSNIKPYCEDVIDAIRAEDPDNIIICGTPKWSQSVDDAANDPITGEVNIMYTLHYYAGTHKADLRAIATTAMNAGLPIFITEFGTVNADGGGSVDEVSSNAWFDYIDDNKLSYCNWSLCDKDEGSAVLNPGTGPNDDFASNLTTAGQFMYNHFTSSCPVYEDNSSTVSVSFTSPNTTSFTTGESITFTVDASDTDGNITSVAFFDGVTLLGTVTSSPFTIDISSLSAGSHNIKAIATGSSGSDKQTTIGVSLYLSILGVETPIIVDATIEDTWTHVEATELSNVILGTVNNDEDLSATYKALWDNDNIYVLLEVADDSKRSNSAEIYNDDAIEIFFDINNDKLAPFDADDFQFNMRYDDASITENQHNATNGVESALTETPTGYIMEFSFPWSTLNGNNPQVGDLLGFDAQINDDDSEDNDRNAKIAWEATSDDTWQDASLMGTIVLGDLLDICGDIISPSIEGATKACIFNATEIYTYSVSGNESYQWFAVNGEILSGEFDNELTVEFSTGTEATIGVIETNIDDCESDLVEIIVEFDCPNGTTEEQLNNLVVFPNPFDETIFAEDFTHYYIYDLTGRLIQNGNIEAGVIHTESLPHAMYVLKLSSDLGVKVLKVSKE